MRAAGSTMRRLRQDASGNFGVMSALFLPVALALSAIAVDHGSLYFERRETQALADLAAISAAARPGEAEAAVLALLARNGLPASAASALPRDAEGRALAPASPLVVVQKGRYAASPADPVAARFQPGATPANAVRVTLARSGRLHFASALMPPPALVASATAAMPAEARFSIGSRLVGLNGGIANALLGELLGLRLSLSVMDYEALASAHVELPDLLGAVAEEIGLAAGGYDSVLSADIAPGLLASALSKVGTLPVPVRTILSGIAGAPAARPAPTLTLGRLLDIGPDGALDIATLSASLNVMELISAAAVVANGTRQVGLELDAGIPGLLSARLDLAIGEPPQHAFWTAAGGPGTTVRTAQTRLLLTVEIGGPGGLLGSVIRLPLYLELAFAEASLSDVSCPTGRRDSARVSLRARPGAAQAWLGTVSPAQLGNFAMSPPVSPATLVKVPLVTVTGAAHASISNMVPQTVVFGPADIAGHAVKSVSTTSPTQSLTASLLGSLSLKVDILGLGLGLPSNIGGLVGGLVQGATPAIDALLTQVLLSLGIRIGEADLRVTGVSCGRPVLVQ